MKSIILVLLSLLFISCATLSNVSSLNKKELDRIPIGAEKVIIKSDLDKESAFNMLLKILGREGWVIDKMLKENFSITTDSKNIGEDTHLRMNMFVDEKNSSTEIIIRGDWKYGQETQIRMQVITGITAASSYTPVKFTNELNKPSLAFTGMIKFAKQYENKENISFQ